VICLKYFLSFLCFFSFLLFRLNADAKVPNLKGITVDKIFGPSTPSAPSGGGEAVAAGGKTYGISRAANAFYAQTRSTVLTRPEVRALGELLVNDRDPIVAMAPKGNHRFVFTNLREIEVDDVFFVFNILECSHFVSCFV
jgi:hypothetical protein